MNEQMKNPFDWKGYIEQKKKEKGTTSGATKTGHEVKKTSTGTVYTKKADSSGEYKAHDEKKASGEEPVKRGRGRPKGKYGSYKERSAETNARAAAKSAASKAANRAKLKEAFDFEFCDELFEDFTDEQDYLDFEDLLQCEEFEQLDEISKATLGSYIKKAANMAASHAYIAGGGTGQTDKAQNKKDFRTAVKRVGGIEKATKRLTKEEVEQIDEIGMMYSPGLNHKSDATPGNGIEKGLGPLAKPKSTSPKKPSRYQLAKQAAKRQAEYAAKKEQNEEVEAVEEGYVVKYHNAKGEHQSDSKVFDNEASAKKHADRGNSADKVGGKYTVHKVGPKGHDVKEEVEQIDESINKYAQFLKR